MLFDINAACKPCGLYQNQLPLIDDRYCVPDVLWVGLSAKTINSNSDNAPLGIDTNTGKIIHMIEADLGKYAFLRINLVKCLPLDQDDRLRYPTSREMKSCYCHFLSEVAYLGPRLVFLLGSKVATFVPVHHPSFIHIYKRKQLDLYVSSIQSIARQTIDVHRKNFSGKAS